MCKMKSGVIDRTGGVWFLPLEYEGNSESHQNIIEHYGLHDDMHPDGESKLCPVEAYPDDPKDIANPAAYKLHCDLMGRKYPAWVMEEMKDNALKVLAAAAQKHILQGKCEVKSGNWILLNAECKQSGGLIHAVINSRNEMSGGFAWNFHDNSRNEMSGGEARNFFNNSRNEMSGGEACKFFGNSRNKMSGGTAYSFYGNSRNKMSVGEASWFYGNSRNKMTGGFAWNFYGNSRNEISGGEAWWYYDNAKEIRVKK